MFNKFAFILFIVVNISFNTAFAFEAMPLPSNLVAFDSQEGKDIFVHSQNSPFWKLMPYFTTQDSLTFCGIASGVMILNALNVPAPSTPEHAPYRIFEQDNFFNEQVLKIITPTMISMHGMTLDELKRTLEVFDVKVKITYGSDIDENDFKHNLISAIQENGQYIIVNIHRKYLHEMGGGHFSPIAAYDEQSDRFLLLDVARYKYPAVWVNTHDLYQAVRLNEHGKVERNRGYLIIKDER